MKKFTKILFITILFTIMQSSIFSDKIILKDGGVVRGKVVTEDKEKLVIANQYGNITIDKKNIKKRIKPKQSRASFKNSTYSIRKKSWTKYAFLGTLAGGLVISTLTFDASNSNIGLITSLSFLTIAITFGVLDFVKYGRIPKKMKALQIGYNTSTIHKHIMNQIF